MKIKDQVSWCIKRTDKSRPWKRIYRFFWCTMILNRLSWPRSSYPKTRHKFNTCSQALEPLVSCIRGSICVVPLNKLSVYCQVPKQPKIRIKQCTMDRHNSDELTSIWWKLFNKASVHLSPHRFCARGVIWNDSDITRNEWFSKFCKHREWRLILVLRSFDILKITRNALRFNNQFSWFRQLQYRGRYWYRLRRLYWSIDSNSIAAISVSISVACARRKTC